MKVGFIQGTFDMFHIGHLNLIKKAKMKCDHLIVTVNTDNFVYEMKNKIPLIPENERLEIIKSIKYVDEAYLIENRNKLEAYKKYNFNTIFLGDDYKGSTFYNEVEKELEKFGVNIVYFDYTKTTSSTKIRKMIEERLLEK